MVSIIKSLIWAVCISATIFALGYTYMSAKGFLDKPPVMTVEERGTKARADDLRDAALDDGKALRQVKFMTHAMLNLSHEKGGMSIVDIHRRKLTLVPPSEDDDETRKVRSLNGERMLRDWIPFYPAPGEDLVADADAEVRRILADRRKDYAEFPCLAVITRYVRPAKWGTQQDEKTVAKFKKEMELLYDDGQGALFFGPKGSTATCK